MDGTVAFKRRATICRYICRGWGWGGGGGMEDGWALRKWEDWSVNQREGGAVKHEGEEGEGKKEGVKFSKPNKSVYTGNCFSKTAFIDC